MKRINETRNSLEEKEVGEEVKVKISREQEKNRHTGHHGLLNRLISTTDLRDCKGEAPEPSLFALRFRSSVWSRGASLSLASHWAS